MKTIEVVEKLNEQLYGEDGNNNENFYAEFSCVIGSYSESISFLLHVDDTDIGVSLWSSENDSRKYIEEKDEYEPLYEYVVNKFDSIINELIRIKPYLK